MFRSGDLFEDLARGLGPDEGLGIGIVVLQVFNDCILELGDALEGAAADAFSGDLGEEPLNHVEPGRRGRREVQLEARMQFDPALHGWRLVSSVVVNDEMEIETGRGLLVDQFEKAQELAVSMPWHAGPDDGAVQHVQSREQGGGAVALQADALQTRIKAMARQQATTLRVGAIDTAAVGLLPLLLNDYQREPPDVKVQVLEDKTPRLLQRVLSGRLDLAFVRPPLSRDRNLEFRHLFYETAVVAVPTRWELARIKRVSVKDITRQPLIVPDKRSRPHSPSLAHVMAGALFAMILLL